MPNAVFYYDDDISKPFIVSNMTLNVCESHTGYHTLGENPKRFDDIRKERVEVVTLDSEFYEKMIPVNFIKIDTEGGEFDVIKGGLLTLQTYKPLILFEDCNKNLEAFGRSQKDLYKILKEAGYTKFKKIGPEEMLAIPDEFTIN